MSGSTGAQQCKWGALYRHMCNGDRSLHAVDNRLPAMAVTAQLPELTLASAGRQLNCAPAIASYAVPVEAACSAGVPQILQCDMSGGITFVSASRQVMGAPPSAGTLPR